MGITIDIDIDIYISQSVNKRVGWCTIGDYETMHTAEAYYMPRDLISVC